jgi:hypothetical protein
MKSQTRSPGAGPFQYMGRELDSTRQQVLQPVLRVRIGPENLRDRQGHKGPTTRSCGKKGPVGAVVSMQAVCKDRSLAALRY